MNEKVVLEIKAEVSSVREIRELLSEVEALEKRYQLHIVIKFNPLVSCFQADSEQFCERI